MSPLSAEACAQRLVAGRGDEYRIAAATAAAIARYRTAEQCMDLQLKIHQSQPKIYTLF